MLLVVSGFYVDGGIAQRIAGLGNLDATDGFVQLTDVYFPLANIPEAMVLKTQIQATFVPNQRSH